MAPRFTAHGSPDAIAAGLCPAGGNRYASGIIHTTIQTSHWYGYYSPMSAIHSVFPSISAY